MTPEAFWKLTPAEFWWQVDARRPPKMYGSLSESDLSELIEDLEKAEAEETHG